MFETLVKIKDDIWLSLGQTALMVFSSLAIAIVLGGALGLFLFATSNRLFVKNMVLNQLVGVILNVIRSVPFLILMIFLLPLSKWIVGTKIGSTAVIVPLSIAATAFFARLAEASFAGVSHGVLEAAVASGAKKSRIIFQILIPEAFASLVKNITVTAISILGYSAMAGLVGGGGLGDLAYRYGYQRYQTEVMIVCVVILIVLVQLTQWLGDIIVKRLNRKNLS
jgi:D-methionine transport system permease protein